MNLGKPTSLYIQLRNRVAGCRKEQQIIRMNKYNVDAVIWDGDGAVGSYTVSFAFSNTDTRPGKINDSAAFSATASKDPNH